MAYADTTDTAASYNEVNNESALWDNNSSLWDISGNVSLSYWDISVASYSSATETTPIYSEQ